MSLFRDDTDLMYTALGVWASYLETGDPTISLDSAKNMGMEVRPMSEGQEQLSKQLRELAIKTLKNRPAAS